MGALPNLIVIGCMKCGTTSLHNYLDSHPDIGMANPKELDWFSGPHSDRSRDWYEAHFDATKSVRGESSQNYSKRHNPFHNGAPGKMAALIPDARLIYVVRDPIERYASHIAENFHGESPDILRWNAENDNHFETGRYHFQLEAFLDYFPQDQLMVIDLDELQAKRLNTMNRIFRFLDLDPLADPATFDFVSNANEDKSLPASLRRKLWFRVANKLMPGPTHKLLGRKGVLQRVAPEAHKPVLTAAQKDGLRDRYRLDVDALRRLTGLRFSGWSV